MKLALSGIYLFFGEQTFESVMARRKDYLMPRSRRFVLLAYCLIFWPLVTRLARHPEKAETEMMDLEPTLEYLRRRLAKITEAIQALEHLQQLRLESTLATEKAPEANR